MTTTEVVVVDAAHQAGPILEAIAGRRVLMIVCTHGHNDHINVAADRGHRRRRGARSPCTPTTGCSGTPSTRGRSPDYALADGETLERCRRPPDRSCTPRATRPGGVCLRLAAQGVVFGGDTLFKGGPGATGRSFSDFGTIISSIERRLLVLPPSTVVHTGHGDDTTIGAEQPDLGEWVARGH